MSSRASTRARAVRPTTSSAQNGEDPDAIMGRPAQQPQAQQQPAYGQPQPQAQQQVWQGQPDPQAQPQQQAWQQPQAQQAAAPWSMS